MKRNLTHQEFILLTNERRLLPVYQPSGLDVGDGVAGHPVARVLLAADDDSQLVGGVLDESHHLKRKAVS